MVSVLMIHFLRIVSFGVFFGFVWGGVCGIFLFGWFSSPFILVFA